MTARFSLLLKSLASPDMLPFSLCSKKRLAIRDMNRHLFPTTLSIPYYDIGKWVGLRTYQHPLVKCCLLSGTGLCDGPFTLPEQFCRVWCVWVWSQKTSKMKRPRPTRGVEPYRNQYLVRCNNRTFSPLHSTRTLDRCVSLSFLGPSIFPDLPLPKTPSLSYSLNLLATGLNFTCHLIILILRLLISYIYGAPSKARNANVV